MSEMELTELARQQLELRREKFKRQGEIKAIDEKLAEVKQSMLAIMDPLEQTKFDIAGKLFYKSVSAYPEERPGKELDWYDWLDARGEGGLAKRSVHWKSRNTWYRNNITGTDKVPPLHPEWEEELIEFLDTFEKININVRGDNEDLQTAIAYEEFKAELNGKS